MAGKEAAAALEGRLHALLAHGMAEGRVGDGVARRRVRADRLWRHRRGERLALTLTLTLTLTLNLTLNLTLTLTR